MVLRVVVGVSWSLITGLAGGWLALSPWALGEQPSSGDWTNVTQTQFWTGAGLMALAVVCLVVVAVQLAGSVRAAPAGQYAGARNRSAAAGPGGAGPEMDAALIALANALVADLNRQPAAPAPAQYPQPYPQPAATQSPAPPSHMAPPNGPPYSYPQPAQPPQAPPSPPTPQPPQQPGEPWRGGR